jgi:hypothetical protein
MPNLPSQPSSLPLANLFRAVGLKAPDQLFAANDKPMQHGPIQPLSKPPAQTHPQQDQRIQTSATQTKANPSLDLFQTAKPLIGPGTKVLHIGDSHTVGIYGREMDKLMRATGASVSTFGSAGSSPSWWLQGTTTHSGFFGRGEDGKIDSPADWKTPHKTPKLPDLLKQTQPSVIVISLGANLIKANGTTIEKQVKDLAEVAKASGAKIIWVGPPDGRESKKPTSTQTALYDHLQKVATQYGTFIDSRPMTEYPDKGGDGVHYWGKEGSKIATNWAHEVFNQIQASNP